MIFILANQPTSANRCFRNLMNPETKQFAKSLRKSMNYPEKLLWSRLRKQQLLGYKFRRQSPMLGYMADFYCPQLSLVIEIDGEIHNTKELVQRDRVRDLAMSSKGFNILRIPAKELLNNLNAALVYIAACVLTIEQSQLDISKSDCVAYKAL